MFDAETQGSKQDWGTHRRGRPTAANQKVSAYRDQFSPAAHGFGDEQVKARNSKIELPELLLERQLVPAPRVHKRLRCARFCAADFVKGFLLDCTGSQNR